jgi:hypothetical protein
MGLERISNPFLRDNPAEAEPEAQLRRLAEIPMAPAFAIRLISGLSGG